MKYEETQYGWLVNIIFLFIIIFILFSYLEQWGTNPIPKIPFLIMEGLFVFIFSLFYKMTIKIEENIVRIIYGIGLIRIKIKPERMLNVEVFKAPWYWGIGIRMTPKGWLYSLNGFKTVLIKYRTKGKEKTTLIGTPDPEKLKTALDRHFFSITDKR